MSLSTGLAVYFLMWWITLFAVLPWGVRSQAESGAVSPGTDPGAPARARLGRKLLWTTFVSAILFGAFYGLYVRQWVTPDGFNWLLGLMPR
jgi:predicted secreted protein